MFGKPRKRMKEMNILQWMWTYLYKDTEGVIKMRQNLEELVTAVPDSVIDPL